MRSNGFSLVEALFAIAILIVGVAALARVSVTSIEANRQSRIVTSAAVLAAAKVEQLGALEWGFDAFGAPISDTSTDTTATPERATGGTGLTPSPPGSLSRNTPGYCDFVDLTGRIIAASGSGPGNVAAPASAAFVRRWSIEPLAASPSNTLVLQVLVIGVSTGAFDVSKSRSSDEARVTTVRTRKAT